MEKNEAQELAERWLRTIKSCRGMDAEEQVQVLVQTGSQIAIALMGYACGVRDGKVGQ